MIGKDRSPSLGQSIGFTGLCFFAVCLSFVAGMVFDHTFIWPLLGCK